MSAFDFPQFYIKCACGCGSEVVTPIHPTRWKLTFAGKSISLYPSIGNWDFMCGSHYWIKRNWIKRNKVVWARSWSEKEISAKRQQEDSVTQRYFEKSGKRDDPGQT